MNQARISTWMAVFLALLATVVSAGRLRAQDYTGTFTLPFETRWGTAVLPAGDYSFSIDMAKSPHWATVRGQNGTVMVKALTVDDRQSDGREALILVRRGNKGTVRALTLSRPSMGSPKGGLVFIYPRPKGELPMLAQAPELIQRVPVLMAQK